MVDGKLRICRVCVCWGYVVLNGWSCVLFVGLDIVVDGIGFGIGVGVVGAAAAVVGGCCIGSRLVAVEVAAVGAADRLVVDTAAVAVVGRDCTWDAVAVADLAAAEEDSSVAAEEEAAGTADDGAVAAAW